MVEKYKMKVLIAASLVFFLAVPGFTDIVAMNWFLASALLGLFSVTLNFMMSNGGLVTFGHALYHGIGGYATAIALDRIADLPLLVSVLIGGLVSGFVALLLCPVISRIRGHSFALVNLAFCYLAWAYSNRAKDLTGGDDGVAFFPMPPLRIPGLVEIEMDDTGFYYFAMTIIALSIWAMWFFTQTPLGSLLYCIRENDRRIRYLGIHVPFSSTYIIVISAFFAGIAGSLLAMLLNIASVELISVPLSFIAVAAVMLGGRGFFLGPLFGAIIFSSIRLHTEGIWLGGAEMILGALLVLVILFSPEGASGIIARVWNKIFPQEKTLVRKGKTV